MKRDETIGFLPTHTFPRVHIFASWLSNGIQGNFQTRSIDDIDKGQTHRSPGGRWYIQISRGFCKGIGPKTYEENDPINDILLF